VLIVRSMMARRFHLSTASSYSCCRSTRSRERLRTAATSAWRTDQRSGTPAAEVTKSTGRC